MCVLPVFFKDCSCLCRFPYPLCGRSLSHGPHWAPGILLSPIKLTCCTVSVPCSNQGLGVVDVTPKGALCGHSEPHWCFSEAPRISQIQWTLSVPKAWQLTIMMWCHVAIMALRGLISVCWPWLCYVVTSTNSGSYYQWYILMTKKYIQKHKKTENCQHMGWVATVVV